MATDSTGQLHVMQEASRAPSESAGHAWVYMVEGATGAHKDLNGSYHKRDQAMNGKSAYSRGQFATICFDEGKWRIKLRGRCIWTAEDTGEDPPVGEWQKPGRRGILVHRDVAQAAAAADEPVEEALPTLQELWGPLRFRLRTLGRSDFVGYYAELRGQDKEESKLEKRLQKKRKVEPGDW